MITSTLLIHSTPKVVLFDFGSMHTFIAKTFINRIGVFVKDLDYYLIILAPNEAILTIGVCVRDVVVVIQQHILLTDFIVLMMREFETIFGIDWMAKYWAFIDCRKKKVQLYIKKNVEIVFLGWLFNLVLARLEIDRARM